MGGRVGGFLSFSLLRARRTTKGVVVVIDSTMDAVCEGGTAV